MTSSRSVPLFWTPLLLTLFLGTALLLASGGSPVAAEGCVNNDDFACADVLGGPPDSQTSDNTGFSVEAGEPAQSCNEISAGVQTAWWVWTAPSAQQVTVDTIGSHGITGLAIYTGDDVGDLTEVACNVGGFGVIGDFAPLAAAITFDAVAGTRYRIQVDSGDGEPGVTRVNITVEVPPTTVSVDPDSATVPTDTPTMLRATYQDANSWLSLKRSYLYISAGASAPFCYVRYEHDLDQFQIFDGGWIDVGIPEEVGSVSTTYCTLDSSQSRVTGSGAEQFVDFALSFSVPSAGTHDLSLVVEDRHGATAGSDVRGQITVEAPADVCTSNDDFACASELDDPPDSRVSNNTGFTIEPGEPPLSCNSLTHPGNHTAWWKWTAPRAEVVTIDTLGSLLFDPVLAVYTGDRLDDLAEVACNDSAFPSIGTADWLDSSITFAARHGTTYYIQVDGADQFTDEIVLNISVEQAPMTVAIDPDAAILPTDLPVTLTAHYNDPNGWQSLNSVELKIVNRDGGAVCKVRLDRRSEVLQIYDDGWIDLDLPGQGAPVSNGLCTLDPSDSSVEWGSVRFPPDGLVVGFSLSFSSAFVGENDLVLHATDDEGNGSGKNKLGVLTVEARAEPCEDNDDFACAELLVGPPDSRTSDNTGFSVEVGESAQSCNNISAGDQTAWWVWTAPNTQQVTVDTIGSDGVTALAIYTGDDVGDLTEVACNVGGFGVIGDFAPLAAAITFGAVAGTRYRLQVDSGDGEPGLIQVNITVEVPPTTVGIDPDAAAVAPNVPTTFRATYQDGNHWLSLRISELRIFADSGAPECRVRYHHDLDLFQIFGADWIDVGIPEEMGTVSTGFCTLDSSLSRISGSGEEQFADFNLSFTSAFAGAHGLFLAAEDDEGNRTTGFSRHGDLTVREPVAGPPPGSGGGGGSAAGAGTVIAALTLVNDDGGTASAADFSLLLNGQSIPFSEATAGASGLNQLELAGPLSLYTIAFLGDCDASGFLSLALGDGLECQISADDIPLALVLSTPLPDAETLIDETLSFSTDALVIAGERLVQASSPEVTPMVTVSVPVAAVPGQASIRVLVTAGNADAARFNPVARTVFVGGTAYEVRVLGANDAAITSFSAPLRLSFALPDGVAGATVAAFYWSVDTPGWTSARSRVVDGRFVVETMHLTAFALFAYDSGSGFGTSLPNDGVALTVFDGGTVEQLRAALSAAGASAVFVTEGGRLVGYLPGAPEFVSAEFFDLFGSSVPAGRPMFLVLGG